MTETKFKNPVLKPGDAGYDEARTVFPGGMDKKPVCIIRPADTGEIAAAIAYAQSGNLPLSVKSGGHSGLGFCVADGGVVLDLHDMKHMEVHADEKTAWAETGLTASEYTKQTAVYGLATGFGDTGTVGIGGITLGGGIGYFVRKYGLTIDSVLAAEVVLPDGRTVLADDTHFPDLFWAIRGGGGNFGVVSKFKYRLYPVTSVAGGMMVLPATAESIASCIDFAHKAPEEFNAIFNVMTAPPMPFLSKDYYGKPVIMILLAYIGDPVAGQACIDGLRGIATPLADMTRVMPYPDLFPPEQAGYHPMAAGRTMFLDSVDTGTAGMILKHISASTASMAVCQLRVLGGAMSRVQPEATAFYHRTSRILANLAAVYQSPAESLHHESWVSEFARTLRQKDEGSYVNFLGNEGDAGLRAAYPGSTYARLAAVKKIYDPDNVFRSNWNIKPET